jgi:hypothetical protein
MNYQNDDSSNDSSFGTLIINNSVKNESDKDASFNISLDSNGSIDSTANVDSNSTCASNDSSNASSNSSKYSRAKRESHKPSKWLYYFSLIENINSDHVRSRCIVCNDEIASSGNTKNFSTHFKIHHPSEYDKIEGKFVYHVGIIFIFKIEYYSYLKVKIIK